jgi:hypothetical protein
MENSTEIDCTTLALLNYNQLRCLVFDFREMLHTVAIIRSILRRSSAWDQCARAKASPKWVSRSSRLLLTIT